MNRYRIAIVALATVAVTAAAGVPALQAAPTCEINWTGGLGTLDWDSAGNWDLNRVPGSGDDVCIGDLAATDPVSSDGGATFATLQSQHHVRVHGGDFTIQDTGFDSSVPQLTLAGGELRGAGRIVVTGDMLWSAGNQRDTGTTEVRGHLAIDNPSTIWFAAHRRMETKGTAAWIGGGTFYVEQESVWTNSGTLLLNSESSMPLWNNGQPNMPRLHNTETGIVRKNAGTGTTSVAIGFDNDGLVEVTSGELRLASDDAQGSTGHFQGAVAVGSGSLSLSDGATFDGLSVAGGTLTVPAGATATGGDLAMSAGWVRGAGTVRVDGTFTWTGGDMADSGHTWVGPGGHVTINAPSTIRLHGGRRLTTDGTGEYLGGTFYGHDNAVWENGGVLDLRSENGSMGHWNDGLGTKAVLRNKSGGKIVRTAGTGTTSVDWWLDNDGDGDVTTGAVRFVAGSGPHVSTGRFGASGTGWFSLGGGTFLIGDGAGFERLKVDGGTVSVNAASTMAGGALEFTNGQLRGLGTIRANGLMRWTGGSMYDAGRTEVGPTGRLEVASPSSIWLGHQRVLRTDGTGEYTSGTWYFEQNALWENGGTFDARSENGSLGRWNIGHGDEPRIHNLLGGTLVRTAGSPGGSTRLDAELENDGRIEVSAGELRLTGGDYAESTGFFGGEGGWTSMVSGRLLAGDGAAFDGLKVDGGHFDVAAGARATGLDLHLAGGELGGDGTLQADGDVLWSGGSLRDQGTTRIGPEGHLRVDSPSSIWNGHRHTLRTDGTGEYVQGTWYFEQDALWENGGTFDARSESGSVGHWNIGFGDYPRMHNLAGGVITKSAGMGDTTIWLDTVNDGRLEPATGRVRFLGHDREPSNGHFGGTGTGHAVVAGGRFLAGEGATFGGGIELTGGQLDVAAGVTMTGTDLAINGGELGGPGTARATGTVTWTGGSMRDSGTTVIAPGGHLEIDHQTSIWLGYQRTLRTEGTGRWKSGTWYFEQESTWDNTGAFAANSESGGMGHWNIGFGGPSKLLNSGTLTKTAGTGTTHIGMPLTSTGNLLQETGELRISQVQGETSGRLGATLAGGSLTVKDGGSLDGTVVAGAQVKIADGVIADAKGVELRSGSLGGRGTIRVADELRWTGGQMVDDGHTDVPPQAKLTISGNVSAVGRYLFTHGSTDWTGGSVSVHSGATWQNTGTLHVELPTGQIDANPHGGAGRGRFVNTGTIDKATTGDTYVYGLENDGTVRIANGRIYAYELRQTPDGRIVAVLGSDANGLTTGRIHVSGDRARLGGILAAEVAAGHTPEAGDSHPAVEMSDWYGTLGTFQEVLVPALADGKTLKSTTGSGTITFSVEGPPAPRPLETAPPAPAAPVAEPAPEAAPPVATADGFVRLLPGGVATVALPEGATVQVLTRTKRATVRIDRKARRLRVKLRRDARGRRLKLRYRVIAADGTRSRITTLTVRIARARR